MTPIRFALPKAPVSTAIEVAHINAPIVVESEAQLRRAQHAPRVHQARLQRAVAARKLTHADKREPTRVASRMTGSKSSGTKIALQPSQVESVHSRRVQTAKSVATGETKKPAVGKATAPIAGTQVGMLPRGSAIHEAPLSGGASYGIGAKRAMSEASTQIDVPALSEKPAKELKVGSENVSAVSSAVGDVRKASGSAAKLPPAQLGAVAVQPAARGAGGIGSVGGEVQGGYGVVALGRSRDSTSSSGSIGELGERPELAGGGKPTSPSSAAGADSDLPIGVARGAGGKGKSTPMVSELVGALAQVGEGGGAASGSPRQLKPQPRIAEPIAKEPETKGYTGLIIDARGLKVERSMSPRVYDERGRSIYGPQMVPARFAIEKGVVYYYTTLEGAIKDPRAGPKPLIIKAVGVRGSANQDVIVTAADGETILRENEVGRFLQRCNVIFVID